MSHVSARYSAALPPTKRVSQGSVSHPRPLSSGKWSPKKADPPLRRVKSPL
jgi:hypothetical protein